MKYCIVCYSTKIDFFKKIDFLSYWKCNFCEATFLDKKNYINSNKEKKHYLKHKNFIDDDGYRKFLFRLIKPLIKYISTNHLGLDYGCGYAPALADILRKKGFKVELFDPFFFPNKNIFLRKFNFITCSEVVEHFFYPHKEFKTINKILNKNGYLAVMTTFMTDNKLFEDWHYRRDPTHVVFYNKKTFKVIAYNNSWDLLFPAKNIVLFIKK